MTNPHYGFLENTTDSSKRHHLAKTNHRKAGRMRDSAPVKQNTSWLSQKMWWAGAAFGDFHTCATRKEEVKIYTLVWESSDIFLK